MIIRANPAAIARKTNFMAKSAQELSEVRKRMVDLINRLKNSYDGEPDSAMFTRKSIEYINHLNGIEKSLSAYAGAFSTVNKDYGKINSDYEDGQRGIQNGLQVQK